MNDTRQALDDYQLHRLPLRAKETLKAWDAADELIVNHLSESHFGEKKPRLLVINDQFGALCCALHQHSITSWSDSLTAHLATQYNVDANNLTVDYTALASTSIPSGQFQLVLIKIPKSLALLEHQLIQLKACINENTTIIAAGMVKYLQKSYLQLFEQYLGTTTTSLAAKKARLIFVTANKATPDISSPYPSEYYQKELQLQLIEHANVFCRGKLDIGSRFMIEQFDHLPMAKKVVDLGCGNGVLGILAKQNIDRRFSIDSHISFVDESYMAVESAKQSYSKAFTIKDSSTIDKQFINSHCLDQAKLNDIELILCNPPFHQNNSVGTQIASQMFKQSQQRLAQGGQLWIVANRHLPYRDSIKRLFGNCRLVASNKKFVVLSATRR